VASGPEPPPVTKALPPAEVASLVVWIATAPPELVLNEAIISPLESAFLEAGLLILTAIWIIYEAVKYSTLTKIPSDYVSNLPRPRVLRNVLSPAH